MTTDFKEQMREQLEGKKTDGWTPEEALRWLEKQCGRSNEEFRGHGIPLVEEVFGGHFEGGQAGAWVANVAPENADGTPVKPITEEAPAPAAEEAPAAVQLEPDAITEKHSEEPPAPTAAKKKAK